ncbi:FAD dependent oxidoreductase [Halosimplex carlsbadense 2-9-1]|uniref:FAD dependent oxidoreductase n=1 Tax=Halosimplex carlsbadense 2-9-1 TaxID=797114 RepID=M0CBK2_9EURY|nr:FAD-dependent oxidoreductase [Halosimplex carlsbadense]ELZ20666.1 FAD dependent oxidoreductase [Halosimplex carlsbadense 2-9-1]
MTRVAVVGGGALGVTAARDLAARGAETVLYERDDLASGASGRAAGIAYDAFAEDIDAAVAERAVERFRNLDDEGAIDFVDHPYVWFARAGDERRAEAVRESAERMRANGRDVATLAPDEFADRFPALAGVDVAVAALARDAGYLDPASYVTAMGERAESAGATVETGTPVRLADDGTAVETPTGVERFDAVLVAAGAHTKRLLACVGVPIPMKPYRVQALVTGPVDGSERVPTCYDASESRYARPREGGLLVGDGTQEREFDPDDYDESADPDFERASLAWLETVCEDPLAEGPLGSDFAVCRSWAGLCTATPDRDPLLGEIRSGLYVATGWHGHGFMRAPALGERIADEMLGGDGIAPFDPDRFDGDEAFSVVEGMTVED